MRGGLTRRTLVASALLALLVGAAFAVMFRAIEEERDSAALATRSQEVIAQANALERYTLDLETGQRGYLITRRERFLEPWRQALGRYRAASRQLVATTAGVPAQERRARRIAADMEAYVSDYSLPLVHAARRGDPAAGDAAVLDQGKRRVDALRREFDAFVAAERRLFADREASADEYARRAMLVAGAGLAGSMLLIVLFGAYLTQAIAQPLRRAADMAGQLAGGDLSTRMPETGPGEVGALERSFNTMAGSLEASRDELRQLAEEQAALRRVATLVARRVPADELFDAVATEVRHVLGADAARLVRHEPDGTATEVAGGSRDGDDVRTSVDAPIVVEGRVWGEMVAGFAQEGPLAPDIEQRLAQFTDLVATAIANAQSRAELAASRARVVATADETRRRIERDLHDGAQQRLVHTVITLKLARRALGDENGPAVELVEEALDHAERATAELRDLAHGILPAALSRGGLSAGIETLVSRVRMPVTVDVTEQRLPPALEATAYFVVAEALTNAVKHAHASRAHVSAQVQDGALRVEVRDDGVGGASVENGSGLLGLHDRAAAMNGQLRVDSPPGGGTVVAVTLPVRPEAELEGRPRGH